MDGQLEAQPGLGCRSRPAAAEAPRPWSTRHSLGSGRESAAATDTTDQSLQPLIIPKFVSLPARPALFSPGYSSLSARRGEASEGEFKKTSFASERSRPPPMAPREEPRRKYFTESSIRRDSQPAASSSSREQQQPPQQVRASVKPSMAPSSVLAPLKLDPADFLPKTEKSAAEVPAETLVAPRKAAVAESALPPQSPPSLPPPPPRLSTLPPESLDGSSDESRDDEQQSSDASTMMFIDRSFRDVPEQQVQQLGDTSTTVSTDFPSDTQSESGSAERQADEDAESSGSSEDSSDDSSTTGSSSTESDTTDSEETSEAEESDGEDDEQQQQQPQPVSKPQPQPQPQQPQPVSKPQLQQAAPSPRHHLTNGAVRHISSESEGEPEKPPSRSAPDPKQLNRSASSSSESSSSGSSGSGSEDDDGTASEEETVIETSMLPAQLLQRPKPDGRLLAHQPETTAAVSYADGLGRQSQTSAALAFVDRQLAAGRASGLSAQLAAAAAAVPATALAQDGRHSPPVRFADEAMQAAELRQGVIRDVNGYLMECVNPRCAKRVDLAESERSFVSCSRCYTYYCGSDCRRGHWEAHKRSCAYTRAADACRSAASRLLQDSAAHRAVSALARAGQRSLGRGCVLLLLSGAAAALPLRPPVFAPAGDLAACGLVGEQLREVTEACRLCDPTGALVLCTGVSVDSGPLVTSWCFLRLAADDGPDSEGSVAAASAAAAEAEQRREQQLRQSRADLLDRVRRELRQRGVSLRHHYPRLLATLQEFVDTGREFPPQSIRPVDTTCGRTFEYSVQPGADPVSRWVEPPQPAARRQHQAPPQPQAPPRRSVVSTDL
ncbi:hypothetical protein BOX15_Mlig005921g1 [Macrostomum lignano]|uniref:MYND-type domain-containing protein n=1 Tax=Macrostomum lignano TaxID=282301 RepID=A0A267DWW9_9PLAT|nr:hypothetical protein BOX15_Mlig005921g1 [Macrostomum lignano]